MLGSCDAIAGARSHRGVDWILVLVFMVLLRISLRAVAEVNRTFAQCLLIRIEGSRFIFLPCGGMVAWLKDLGQG
jgi:hypothetical protein